MVYSRKYIKENTIHIKENILSHKSATITAKISKLLNLANDQQGTAEGDAALSRAMKLMAQYGIEENEVHTHNAHNNNDMGKDTIVFDSTVSYRKQQHILVTLIARSLGCFVVGQSGGYRKGVGSVDIYGRDIDRERVKMLFSVASLTMVDSAMKAIPAGTYDIRRKRLSHMVGYASAIKDSLQGHEAEARSDNGDGVVAIINDKEKAKEYAMGNDNLHLRKSSSSSLDRNSYGKGYNEGSQFDTGKTRRISGHRALSA